MARWSKSLLLAAFVCLARCGCLPTSPDALAHHVLGLSLVNPLAGNPFARVCSSNAGWHLFCTRDFSHTPACAGLTSA